MVVVDEAHELLGSASFSSDLRDIATEGNLSLITGNVQVRA